MELLLKLGSIAVALGTFFYIVFKMAEKKDLLVSTVPMNTPVSPESAPTATQTAGVPLSTFCRAIEAMEGANPLNNNPGNCRCSPIGYDSRYGTVKCSPKGFAMFTTYSLGWEYLNNLVHHRVILHPDWTFYDFFNNYAPSSDHNNPKHYAEFVAAKCNTSPNMKLSTFLT